MKHNHKHHMKDLLGREDQNVKKRSIHRIKIIQGHLERIEKMLENDKYCLDIVHQSRAVQSALKHLDLFIIENHLKTCVIDQVRNGEEEKTVAELLRLFEYKG